MHRILRTTLVLPAAAFLLSGCASDRVASLESENLELRQLLAMETARQMRDIGLYAAIYAQDNGNAYPTKPSELRETLDAHGEDWSIFLAPYDATPNRIMAVHALDDPWAWIDTNSSFEFARASLGTEVVAYMTERAPVLPGVRYTLFSDAHVEAVAE